jgi:glycyl-tRNA synthetase beta chain
LAGYFGLGLVPKGSSDPFALRRAGQGAIRILLDFWPQGTERNPDLRYLINSAVGLYRVPAITKQEEAVESLASFLLERLRFVLLARGFSASEVDAVLAAQQDALLDPIDAHVRLKALSRVRAAHAPEFQDLSVAFKRIKNILDKAPENFGVFDEGWLEPGAEQELHEAVQQSRLANTDARDLSEYERRFRAAASLRSVVTKYFEDVHVMADDLNRRRNRLAFLSYVISPIQRIADISKLGGQA